MSRIKKIAFVGVESSGKSFWCSALASHYQEPMVAEFARTFLPTLTQTYTPSDLLHIAKEQWKAEQQLILNANKILCCDTDLANIQLWSEIKFNACDSQLLRLVAQQHYDAYILTPLQEAWEFDPLREYPDFNIRQRLYYHYLDYALSYNKALFIMQSSTTLADLVNFTEKLLTKNTHP